MAYVLQQINKSFQYYMMEHSGRKKSAFFCAHVIQFRSFFRSSIGAFAIDKFAVANRWPGRCLSVFCVVAGTAVHGKTITIPN